MSEIENIPECTFCGDPDIEESGYCYDCETQELNDMEAWADTMAMLDMFGR
jgi:hypothetical protein